MSDDSIHRQEFAVRDLPTKSVTLYPARAQVVRDIDGIILKPGSNEVIIHGLTPTAEESSIKVDGKGAATIVDMAATLVDNKDKYEDLYPSDSEASESEEDESDEEVETEGSKKINAEIEVIKSKVKDAVEGQNAALDMLEMIKQFGFRVGDKNTTPFQDAMEACGRERQKAYELHKSSTNKLEQLRKDLDIQQKELKKELEPAFKEKDKISKAKHKQLLGKHKIKAEKAKAKLDLKRERTQFWPKQVYKIILSLDASPDMTPLSSRRGSMDTLVKPAALPESSGKTDDSADAAPGVSEISLSISYITQGASWSPRYDLNLSTLKGNGAIVYRAEFVNTTSETWNETKLVLSTSQTTFQGLGEPIPELLPWPIRLNKNADRKTDIDILYSRLELDFRRSQFAREKLQHQNHQKNLFGFKEESGKKTSWDAPSKKAKERIASSISAAAPPPASALGGLFGNSRSGPSSAFGSAAPTRHNLLAQKVSRYRGIDDNGAGQQMAQQAEIDNSGFGLFDDGPNDTHDPTIEDSYGGPSDHQRSLTQLESTWAESGLTTTYEIPGQRTISPSTTPRRHKIATITLKDIHLSYILIPKLRTAAFLKAKLRNNSGITLLKGPAGLTLDGSFLGNTQLPRCSPGETFPLSLGVDPAINVSYSKPTVRRSQTGVLFSKEGSCVFTRVCTVTNTKSSTAIEGVVVDQVPVSEDERLRVEVLYPKGLKAEGDRNMKAGVPAESTTTNTLGTGTGTGTSGSNGISSSSGGSSSSIRGKVESITGSPGTMGKDEKWGKAVATFKKGGEVAWDIKVLPGQGVRLVLEYETRFPGGEGVVGV